MANSHRIFEEFNKVIRLSSERRVILKERRDSLRSRINQGFENIKGDRLLLESIGANVNEELEFQSQGSFVMDTIITPSRQEDEYDLDDGVYFKGNRTRDIRPSEQNFHDFIIESVKGGQSPYDIEKIVDKKTCVRVKYKGDNGDFNYHVDLPIYYAIHVETPDLADTGAGWHISSPVEFILWFENKIQSGFEAKYLLESRLYGAEYEQWLNDRRKKDHQLRRIVRYLKAWGDHLKGEMPPGVVMTILAASGNNYAENEREDIALRDTLINIRSWLRANGFRCPRPTTPEGEDLFKGYSETKKQYFLNALDSFIQSANQAIQHPNPKDACHKWQRHLGDRFPCNLAKDEIEQAKTYVAPAVIGSDNSRSA
ncbi:cyclic GMP-AMP synthase DncV-like nucleotidyltransferase [Roseivirga pacifica]